MCFSEYFPVFSVLSPKDQSMLASRTALRQIKKGTMLHRSGEDCLGLLLIRSGQLRAFISSPEGKEITVYRLFERDVCLFSASCIMKNIQFDLFITAEKDTEAWLIPLDVYQDLSARYAAVANYTNELMGARFTEVMWLMEQILFQSFDQRLASFLLEESAIEGAFTLSLTHEKIASHLGTAREVVTRMLRYFQSEGAVRLSRGAIEIADEKKLLDISLRR